MTGRDAGVVREWHDELGWGVLTSSALDGTVWAHFSAIFDQEGFRRLRAGQDVEFTWERAEQDGHHLRATGVWFPGGESLPEPAPFPGSVYGSELHLTGTVFCAVYGSIALHSWVDPAEADAYGLFVARSTSLGWWSRPGAELWGMNDAAGAWQPADDEHDEAAANAAVGGNRVAWFQVGLPDVAEGRPVPVQAVVACAQDVVERVGRVDLAALQVLVPMQPASPQLVWGLSWFGLTDPQARTTLRVTADAGDDPTPSAAAAEILAFLQGHNTGAFTITGTGADPVEPRPTVVAEHWIRPGRFPLTLTVDAPEWSFAAAGWLLAMVAEACREAGTRGDVLISVTHSA